MAKSKNKFFVVWDGIEPGVYDSWAACKNQIHGYGNAIYKGFETKAAADEAFLSPYWNYIGKNAKKKQPTTELIAKYGQPNFESLSVDAACSGNPGVMEYQGVYTKTGEVVFKQGPFLEGTNNVGEFLALVHGLALLKQKGLTMPLYTDSKTAMAWLKKKKTKTELLKTPRNKQLFDLMFRAEKWLVENDYTTEVLKWHTEAWGEIPADFGRK